MSTRTLARLALALVVLVALAAACQPVPLVQPSFPDIPHTTHVEDAGPIQVIAWGYCRRDYGTEIQITNQERGNIPITVQFDDDYTAELVYIAQGATRHWSWPGSWPDRLVVRIGGPTGLIVMDYAMSHSCTP